MTCGETSTPEVGDLRQVLDAEPLHPRALAVEAADARLTHGQLHTLSGRLAEILRDLGALPSEPVALCAPRSAALVVGALGIMRAGGVYVALDPAHPRERLQALTEQVGARVAVTSAAQPIELDDQVTRVVVDAGSAQVRVMSAATGRSERGRDNRRDAFRAAAVDAAYAVFTSGSTGTPKAVLTRDDGLANLVAWHLGAFCLSSADRTTLIASPGFDASVWELWPTLVAGGSLHVPPEDVRLDPPALRDWMLARGITVSFVPTALAESLVQVDWPSDTPMRYLLTGGDALHSYPPPGLPFTLVNNYGVSEATVVSTSIAVSPRDGADSVPAIGRPVRGVQLKIVDAELNPVPEGSAGELLVGGPSVGLCYLGEPELTARSFISLTDTDEQSRWYRTGDLVRRRTDGCLEHLGRLDEQVQVRGFRVELGEVAAALNCHPDVRTSVVTFSGDGIDGKLCAYVVAAEPGASVDRQALWSHMKVLLPDPMLPGAIVQLSAMPTTRNGKVERAALPEPGADDRVGAGWENSQRPSGASPESDDSGIEQELLGLVSGVACGLLAVDAVSADDNFFLLGGHSMLGAQLIAGLDDLFGVQLPLRALFGNPTIAGIAAEVQRALLVSIDAVATETDGHLADSSSGA